MKKSLLFVAALAASLGMNAQESALVKTDGFSTTAVAATSGTVLASTNNVTMTIAFDDSYKTVTDNGPKLNESNLCIYTINGENFNAATDMGLQGSANPKDADGGTPSSTLKEPVSGCVYGFEVKKDGYLYIFAKLSSNKNYTVFEEGKARDYSYAQGTTTLDNTLSYTLKGNSEGYLTDAVLTPQEYDARYGTAYNTASMGVIKVSVFAGCKYLFNANGSKATVLGYYYDKDGKANINITDGASNTIKLLSDGATGINATTAATAVDSKTALYNLAGQKVNKDYKGIVIQNGKKFINK